LTVHFIIFVSVMPGILKLARHLLRKLGINSKIYTWKHQLCVKDPKSRKIYQRKQDIAYCLVISRRENIVKFARKSDSGLEGSKRR